MPPVAANPLDVVVVVTEVEAALAPTALTARNAIVYEVDAVNPEIVTGETVDEPAAAQVVPPSIVYSYPVIAEVPTAPAVNATLTDVFAGVATKDVGASGAEDTFGRTG